MDEKKLKEAISTLRKDNKKKFTQSVDLIINLKNLDLKKPEHQVEFYLQLPKNKGKKSVVCALVAGELADQAKEAMDSSVMQKDFEIYQKDKKKTKKLASSMDFFVAQATIMPKVAAAFGRVLGPKGKMPNPKAGCIVPPNANLSQVYEKLQKTVKLSAKKAPLMQTICGNEDSSDEDLIENIKYIYNNVEHHLPQGINNIKSVYVKFTMTKPIKVM
ncbi:50S ribosomal protein L1 [archaeon]|jgi:large subunit ribosomal protein L1|nr:50S ribosomal protein L1 [archaeon]MBT4272757.1 50S ribosomal protein L1 [archaeon]MBT4461556.1 50S ribosomal protein L1 [archaeon]MBT4857676.1 50S ribosomal protein L1 [archaeon]MBT5423252.1 50S ribosomal protein L1 [archaeon]